jgi:hypothetical protein
MTTTSKPMSQRSKNRLLLDVTVVLTSLYNRMDGHIHRYVTDDDVVEKMVKPQDREMVYRSEELFGYVRSSYYGKCIMRVQNFPGMVEHTLYFDFSNSKFLVPDYLRGNVTAQSLGEDFIQFLKPYVEEAASIRTMYLRSVKAWLELRKLCDDDLARIQFLWPSIDAIAQRAEIPITRLAKPRGVPSPDPALREALNDAATFINTALLMPQASSNRQGISYGLES